MSLSTVKKARQASNHLCIDLGVAAGVDDCGPG